MKYHILFVLKWHFKPPTLPPLSRKTQHNRGRGGNSAHDEDDDSQAALAADTDQAHSKICTTRINNVLDHLLLFQS